jgi:hypothetical protein
MNSFMPFSIVIISLPILMKITGMVFTFLSSYLASSVPNKRGVCETVDVRLFKCFIPQATVSLSLSLRIILVQKKRHIKYKSEIKKLGKLQLGIHIMIVCVGGCGCVCEGVCVCV